jgi:2-oxo-3-hexenedioate decarboxylase
MPEASVLAEELHEARRNRATVPPITSRHPGFRIEEAYDVQAAGVRLRLDEGETIAGGKLGFTSVAMQRAMGVDAPNYGWLTDAMLVHDRTVRLDGLIHPKVEPEIAFLLGADLEEDATPEAVLAATAAVVPCLEVVDSRYHGFRFGAADNIADNSSAGEVVLGDAIGSPGSADWRLCGVVLRVDGEVVSTAAGAAALGHPAAAVAWMARAVAGRTRPLRNGDIVISGGLTAPVDLSPGMTVSVEIDHIGSAGFRVTED